MIFVKGLLIGFLMAFPVGPSGAISARRALTHGPRAGFISGLAASVADVVYLSILEFGTARFHPSINFSWIRIIAGAVTIYIGVRLLRQTVTTFSSTPNSSPRDLRLFTSAFLVSLANPTILVSFAVLLETLGLGKETEPRYSPTILILSVFCGSILLWVVLARSLSNSRFLALARRVAGIAFLLIGLGIVWPPISKLISVP